ncbi:MAG TPA: POTRA domain-containing protein [Isosphaeraceae bacterium]|nr:POTRA domain-containing protein [Isosphaeraceae bacterium]
MMPRCAVDRPSAPAKRPAAAGRPAGRPRGARASARATVAVALAGLALAWAGHRGVAVGGELPTGDVVEIRIEGNKTVPEAKIRTKIVHTKVGRPLTRKGLQADHESLWNTRWFSSVTQKYTPAADNKGIIVFFIVEEMPLIQKLRFEGMTKLYRKDVEKSTQLKEGERADWRRATMAVATINSMYKEKGYEFARVELIKGGKPDDTEVHIRIFEGPKVTVGRVEFVGNTIFDDDHLRDKVVTGAKFWGLIRANFQRDIVEQDAQKLKDFYQGLGYLEVQVTPVVRSGATPGDQLLTFVISEGVQFKVRDVRIEGNTKIKSADLLKDLKLHSGQPFSDALREADLKSIQKKYRALGYMDFQIAAAPRYRKEPGVIDLLYHVEEGNPYRIGEIIVTGNQRTRRKVVLRELQMAHVFPGAEFNGDNIELAQKRLGNLRYFNMDPQGKGSKPIEIKTLNKRGPDQPYWEEDNGLNALGRSLQEQARFQSPDDAQGPAAGAAPEGPPAIAPLGDGPLAPGRGGDLAPIEPPAQPFAPPADAMPGNTAPVVPLPPGAPAPAPGPRPRGRAGRTPPLGAGEPPGSFPDLPGTNATDVGPDRNEPFPNRSFTSIAHAVDPGPDPRSYADLGVHVDEGQTGSFMLGVAANSYQGLLGNLVLNERNFDITKLPTSFADLISGNAFRGGGQQLRIELMPGNLINYANATFTEPYLFNQPIGFNLSGYGFTRTYPDFRERRVGMRTSLGYQWGTQTYMDVAFRVEDVTFNGFRTPAPADYLAASGHTLLATIRPSIRFDTRNDLYMPTRGSYAEAAFEQGWGNFTFSKFTVEGRQHFLLRSRPDGTGPHILTMRGFFGITGPDTPVYERFFAGDIRSMRGFYYRGVGPHVLGSNIGGLMSAIGSIEYQYPLMANDMLHQVWFCDFGTVDRSYQFSGLRAAVGTGFRVIVPAMGKMPIAFDFALPVSSVPGDHKRYFHFFVGTFW